MDRHIVALPWRLHSTPRWHRPRYAHRARPLVATAAVRDRVAEPCVLSALRPFNERSRVCQEPRAEVVCLRGERAGALRLVQEDGKHRVFELGPLVFDALAHVGLLKSRALHRL
jgi:hypothetical protein